MRPVLRRLALVLAAALAVAALLAQLFLPGRVASDVRERITAGGGSAEVSVRALPAIGLLLGRGDGRLEVRAQGVDLDPAEVEPGSLARLDRFRDVDLRFTDGRAGPIEARVVSLERHGRDEPYRLRIDGTLSPADLGAYAGGQIGPLGAIAGGIAGGIVDVPGGSLPLDLEAELETDGDEIRVVSGGGDVAGVPLGPLAELVVSAVAARL